MSQTTPTTILADEAAVEYQIEDCDPVEEAGIEGVENVKDTESVAGSTLSPPKLLGAIESAIPLAPICSSSATPPSTAPVWIPLNEFKYFPKLPFELRNMIYVIVIKDSDPRILGIQPQYREHPGLIQTWKESRTACQKYYHYCASKQRTKVFRMFIDYGKDVLYLNHPFTLLGGRSQQGVLQSAHSIYPEFLELIETVAVNLKEVRNLSGPHRGKNTIWLMLSKWCPNLKELRIVVNNFPTNGLILRLKPIMTVKDYKDMVPKSKQTAIEEISGSFKKAKNEEKILAELKMRLVLIDEEAPKVRSRKERAAEAMAWKEANKEVDGVSEVDELVQELDGDDEVQVTGKSGLGGTKKDKKGKNGGGRKPRFGLKHQKTTNGKVLKTGIKKGNKPSSKVVKGKSSKE